VRLIQISNQFTTCEKWLLAQNVDQKALRREKKLNNAFGPRGFGLKAFTVFMAFRQQHIK